MAGRRWATGFWSEWCQFQENLGACATWIWNEECDQHRYFKVTFQLPSSMVSALPPFEKQELLLQFWHGVKGQIPVTLVRGSRWRVFWEVGGKVGTDAWQRHDWAVMPWRVNVIYWSQIEKLCERKSRQSQIILVSKYYKIRCDEVCFSKKCRLFQPQNILLMMLIDRWWTGSILWTILCMTISSIYQLNVYLIILRNACNALHPSDIQR